MFLFAEGLCSGSQWRTAGCYLSRMQGYMSTSSKSVLLPRSQLHVTAAPALYMFSKLAYKNNVSLLFHSSIAIDWKNKGRVSVGAVWFRTEKRHRQLQMR